MIKAAVCREFNQPLTIETVSLAEPGPEDVQVKIEACAICHSDIFYLEGAWGGTLPAIFGHEAAGTVTAIGSQVRDFKVGQKLLVTLIRSCGHCKPCHHGATVLCEQQFDLDHQTPLHDKDGAPIVQGLRTGAFAEAVTVHQSQLAPLTNVVNEPVDIPLPVASLLSCGVITGLGAVVNTAKMPFGANVAVIGCGGVGLNTIQGAALAGAAEIIAIDIEDDKLAIATEFGATRTANPKQGSLRKQVKALTNGAMVDYVFVTVGVKPAFDDAPTLIGRMGKIILVGMPPTGTYADYDPSMMASLGSHVIGSKMGDVCLSEDIPKLLTLYQQGKLQLDRLVSKHYPLEAINDAIAEAKSGKIIRNVILMD